MTMGVTGTLIEMNSHMIVADGAKRDMIIGLLGVIIFAGWMVYSIIKKQKLWTIIFAILILFEGSLFVIGVTTPCVKEIRYCANGPIQIEEVAAKFDIVSIDGKEIIVRER